VAVTSLGTDDFHHVHCTTTPRTTTRRGTPHSTWNRTRTGGGNRFGDSVYPKSQREDPNPGCDYHTMPLWGRRLTRPFHSPEGILTWSLQIIWRSPRCRRAQEPADARSGFRFIRVYRYREEGGERGSRVPTVLETHGTLFPRFFFSD